MNPDTLLFYSPGACSLASQVVLEWINQPYKLCRVDPSVRGSDAFKRINPLGKVPALRLGKRILTESSAILVYLANRRPDLELVPPAGTVQGDEMNQWLSYFSSGFHVAFYPYFLTGRYAIDPAAFPTVKDAAIKQIRKEYTFVDRHLANRRYVLGEVRSILDPYLNAMARWAVPLFDIPTEYPNVAQHMSMMNIDPAVRFAYAIERGETDVQSSGEFAGLVELDAIP
jgi:glutathione S-transferase